MTSGYLSVATMLFALCVCVYRTEVCMGRANLWERVGFFLLRAGGSIKGPLRSISNCQPPCLSLRFLVFLMNLLMEDYRMNPG